MFHALGRGVVRFRWFIIAAWVVAAGLLVTFAPTVESAQDQSEFLPDKYESVQALDLEAEKFASEEQGVTASIVSAREDREKLSEADSTALNDLATKVQNADIEHVVAAYPGEISPDETVQMNIVQFADETISTEDLKTAVEEIREVMSENSVSDMETHLTGEVAIMVDSTEEYENTDSITLMLTFGVVIIALLIVFRAPLLALLTPVLMMILTMVSQSLINVAVEAFDLTADDATGSIVPIVVIGVGVDYILFFMFRYKERLQSGVEKKQAVSEGAARASEIILFAAAAVIIAFSALILAQLSFLRTMGPSLAIAVATAALAALTLVPAVISLIPPRVLFWPSKAWQKEPKHVVSGKIGGFMGRRPIVVTLGSFAVLGALAFGALAYSPNYDMMSAPKDSEADKGLEMLYSGFPKGVLDATNVFVHSTDGTDVTQDDVMRVSNALQDADGVSQVQEFDPEQGFSEDGSTATFDVILEDGSLTGEAMETMKDSLRPTAHDAAPEGTEVLLGGGTSVFVDMEESMMRDYSVVFPVAAVLIAIILAILLRSLVAPLYLLIGVALTFLASIGSAVLLFDKALGHNGVVFFMPVIVYLFVVALGTDYNILMIARLREEARKGKKPAVAARDAFMHAGPTVGAAGLILAGSFATFLFATLDVMLEFGVSVAIGIALAAFVMSMFLIPSFTRLLGHAAWWPGHGDEAPKQDTEAAEKTEKSDDTVAARE